MLNTSAGGNQSPSLKHIPPCHQRHKMAKRKLVLLLSVPQINSAPYTSPKLRHPSTNQAPLLLPPSTILVSSSPGRALAYRALLSTFHS